MPKVHIATPAYDGKVHSGYAKSLLLAGYILGKSGIEISGHIAKNGIFIDMARSHMVKLFLKTDATHLMFIDSDMEFEPRAIAALVSSGLPLCGGLYRQRSDERIWITEMPDNKVNCRDGWVQVNRMPTGFMCIERHVLEVMSEKAPKFMVEDEPCPMVFKVKDKAPIGDGPWRVVGEDYSFCDDYMALYRSGVFKEPIWIWPDIDFVHDIYPCNFHKYLLES